MDGRVQVPVAGHIKETHGVDYVDVITAPGVNRLLSDGNDGAIDSIKKCVEISVQAHGSKLIAIVGHHDCAGNPTDESTQLRHIQAATEVARSWELDAQVVGLWVDEDWEVSEVR